MNDERCPVTDLIASQCAHCRQVPVADLFDEPAERPGPWFQAFYAGECAGCCDTFGEGEQIRADGHGGYLAECCG